MTETFRTFALGSAILVAFAVTAVAQEPAPSTPDAATPPGAVGETTAAPAGDAFAAPTGDADDAGARLGEMSPLVADVQIVGQWTDGERTGIWRTITLQPEGENAGNRFFVQQIERIDGVPAVSSSTEIVEIGREAGALVTYRADPPSETQPELLTIFFDLVPLDGEITQTFELFFTPGEPYTFGPASN